MSTEFWVVMATIAVIIGFIAYRLTRSNSQGYRGGSSIDFSDWGDD